MVERISTGIIGLDGKIEGGFVKGSVNLITGKTGTGKTAFSSSFLYKGAKEGQPGVYITTEEREEDIIKDVKAMFGWDLKELADRGLLKFVAIKPTLTGEAKPSDMSKLVRLYISDLLSKMKSAIKKIKAKLFVLDSVSVVEMFIQDEYMSRSAIMQITDRLKKQGVTSILTGTVPETSEALSGGGIVEYVVDSVIKLDFTPVAEEFKRTLEIRKMRRTNHSIVIHPFDISEDGVKVIEVK